MKSPELELRLYAQCLEEVVARIEAVLAVEQGIAGLPDFVAVDVAYVQLRKALEQIALASLVANKTAYAEAHKNFSKHWNGKKIFSSIRLLNSDFYPMPLILESKTPIGPTNHHYHFGLKKKGHLAESEFVQVYNECGAALHSIHPYRT